MEESWSEINGFNGKYMISDEGRVWSNNYNKELKQIDNGKGYLRVNLCFNAKCKAILVHRLVAEHFLPKEKGKHYINHKDENSKNNKLSNLEWCTFEYNINYGNHNSNVANSLKVSSTRKHYDKSQSIPVVGISIKTGECKYYKSMMEAERNGFHSGHISDCVRGINKSHKGYKWFKQSEYKGVS
ncbi:NUMOD4 domain-containing protein [Staphylococcus gallinarum]|uniref:NUMOD4 domain-containing protein n=1 Tax=Staphylococcus gallinarum TaxID=1293 RepID=UPI001E611DC9|nr:NUMOD4 domain-containing protein [Staphylococcus gallinarum]MCD8872112.1 HNH endonuclease [Staphylococcus gallinarum]